MAYKNQFSYSNGTSTVTICNAPASSYSRTIGAGCINIYNNDANTISITLSTNVGGTAYVQDYITIDNDDSWGNDKQILCLDATDETLEIFLSGSVVTEADVSVIYRDEAQ